MLVNRYFGSKEKHITRATDTPLEGFLNMMHSAGSAEAEIGRAQIESHNSKTLIGVLVFSLVAGVQAMRQMIGLSALDDGDPKHLVALLTPAFRQRLTPET